MVTGFDQLLVNEYAPGQGIAKHVDAPHLFRDGIASLTLGSGTIVRFEEVASPTNRVEWYAARRSVFLLTGPARYEWRHEIPKRKVDGVWGARGRRVSLTFRRVILRR